MPHPCKQKKDYHLVVLFFTGRQRRFDDKFHKFSTFCKKKRAHDCELFCFLISASLSCCFRLLLFLYGRLFVEFLLTKIAQDTVAGAFSLKTTKRAFNVFVFANSYRRHTFSPSFADAFNLYHVIIAISKAYVKLFSSLSLTFLRIFPFYSRKKTSLLSFRVETGFPTIAFFQNLRQGVYTKDK